jgi:hypothetical protein
MARISQMRKKEFPSLIREIRAIRGKNAPAPARVKTILSQVPFLAFFVLFVVGQLPF